MSRATNANHGLKQVVIACQITVADYKMRCQRCTQITVADIRGCEILQQPSFMALKSSAESGCDLCGLSYVAIMSDYSHAMTKFENEDVSVIEMLLRGQNPMRNGKHDTAVFIEGELNDYQPCNRFNEKAEKVSVRIGSPLSGENSPIVFLKVGVDPGWQLIPLR